MKIGYSKSAAATPAFALIAEGWNELVQDGLTPDLRGNSPVDWPNQVLYAAREDGEVVGVLCYGRDDVLNAFLVTLAYVEPTSRRQGVFRELWGVLLDKAKDQKIGRVILDVNVANRVALDTMGHLGVLPVSISHELILGG
jgi:GNAT superfamily N-acetyltransferase